jgi:gliding motility-associated lipoprotein GldK
MIKNVLPAENGKEFVTYSFTHLKRSADGKESKEVTDVLNIYPDTKVWATDFPNSQTDMLVKEYFTNPAYDDYPVVGVTWMQARAYADWRSNSKNSRHKKRRSKYMMDYDLPCSLPTEAQWVYAAEGEVRLGNIDSFRIPRDKKGLLLANFKQSEGDYNADGSSYTMQVKAYAPNRFGLYNMYGNVAEWVLDAYNESAWAFVHDQNPVLLYDAEASEADIMKRKVVRGGSWKDNAQSLSPYSRSFEIQDVPHSYIGFRCVMPAPEILTRRVASRQKREK